MDWDDVMHSVMTPVPGEQTGGVMAALVVRKDGEPVGLQPVTCFELFYDRKGRVCAAATLNGFMPEPILIGTCGEVIFADQVFEDEKVFISWFKQRLLS